MKVRQIRARHHKRERQAKQRWLKYITEFAQEVRTNRDDYLSWVMSCPLYWRPSSPWPEREAIQPVPLFKDPTREQRRVERNVIWETIRAGYSVELQPPPLAEGEGNPNPFEDFEAPHLKNPKVSVIFE